MKRYFLSAFIVLTILFSKAQVCTPNLQYSQKGFYPDSITGLPAAYVNAYYDKTITVVLPYDTVSNGATIKYDSLKVKNWNNSASLNLPPGLNIACEPPACVFSGPATQGTLSHGCIRISGTVLNVSDTGTYDIFFDNLEYLNFINPPFGPIQSEEPDIGYYSINVMMPQSPPTASFTLNPDTICQGSCINFEDNSLGNPANWTWTFPGADVTTSNLANPVGICFNSPGTHTISLIVSNSGGSDTATQTIIVKPSPSVTITKMDISCAGCNDGSATASVSGGITPYLFSWNNGATSASISSLAAGNYSLTVTGNNNCACIANISIVMPGQSTTLSAISAGATHSIFLCEGNTPTTSGGNYYGQLGDGTTLNKNIPIKADSLNGTIGISAGLYHSVFLKNDSSVWVCGVNSEGQLGDGTTFSKATPFRLNALSGIKAIAGGGLHSMFLKYDGSVWVCGGNYDGQLGDGTTVNRLTPVPVNSLSGIVSVAGANGHSLFLKNDGTVWACGQNDWGQLGDGTTTKKTIPIQVNGLNGVTAIEAGQGHSLFLKSDGTVWACGNNNYGQLGDGTTNSTYTNAPVQVSSLTGIIAISAGDLHSLFLKNDSTVWACGYNNVGQLGDGTSGNYKTIPVKVGSLSGVTAISGGELFSLFLKSNGSLWACGYNDMGQLADGTNAGKASPVEISAPLPLAFTGGNSTICPGQSITVSGASANNGSVLWTHNGSGSISGATTIAPTYIAAPEDEGNQVDLLLTVTGTDFCGLATTAMASYTIMVQACTNNFSSNFIAAGSGHSVFLCSNNTPMACGYNITGQLGDGTNLSQYSAVPVSSLENIISVMAGTSHSLFLKNDGTVWACGSNYSGALGDGTTQDKSTPIQISSLSGIIALAGGDAYSLFLKNDGSVWACGYNNQGQLGDGTIVNKTTPVQVNSLSGIIAIASGGYHSLFLKNDGSVWACGGNSNGQIGVGTSLNSYNIPVQVSSIGGITAIAAGYAHSLFVKNDGTVWSCGANWNGELGDGTAGIQKLFPGQVNIVNNIVSVAAGNGHSLFLGTDGNVWACGKNYWGELGDGTTTDRYAPVQISTLTGITEISTYNAHSLFLKNDGSVWACGDNADGKLGDGTIIQRNSPVQVLGLCSAGAGEEEKVKNERIAVFPNPSRGVFTVSGKKVSEIFVYNVLGEIVLQQYGTNSNEIQIDISKYGSGIFYFDIINESGNTVPVKIVVN